MTRHIVEVNADGRETKRAQLAWTSGMKYARFAPMESGWYLIADANNGRVVLTDRGGRPRWVIRE